MPEIQPTQLLPFYIGNIRIDPPLVLAPMIGYTHYAFRALCREVGDCGLVYTGLLSSVNLQHERAIRKNKRLLDWRADEKPIVVQLSGRDPAVLAKAARVVVDFGAEIVDINMGCSVPKVAKSGEGAGAALLRDLDKAIAIIQAVVDAVSVPVTIKIRNGWSADNPVAVPLAVAAEQIGVKAIAIHARFAEQKFGGQADWEYIRQVKAAVSHIPVIGNGDVITPADAIRMFQFTGCDGVMIGRAALGNPWLFRQIAQEIRSGVPVPPPTLRERAEMAIRQAQLTLATTASNAPIHVVHALRGQLLHYMADFPNAKQIRAQIVRVESLADIEAVLRPFCES